MNARRTTLIHVPFLRTSYSPFISFTTLTTVERRAHINSSSVSPLYSDVFDSLTAHIREKRSIISERAEHEGIKKAVTVETAVFVDETLYDIMQKTFPVNTEQEIVTYVLTIMNAVQLLFVQSALGQYTINISIVLMDILKVQPRVCIVCSRSSYGSMKKAAGLASNHCTCLT